MVVNIIIIGGQAAGMTCAAKLRRSVGDEIKIIVLEEIDVISLGSCGLPYYIADHFDDANRLINKTPQQMLDYGVDLRINHQVIKVDHQHQLVTVKDTLNNCTYDINYSKLVIATGASAGHSELVNNHTIFTIRDFYEAQQLKHILVNKSIDSLTIIGAGYIGLEMLELVKAYNLKHIYLISNKANLVDGFLDLEFSEVLNQAVDDYHNIKVIFNERAEIVSANDQGVEILLQHTQQTLLTDIVIFATGIKPRAEIFNNLQLKLATNKAIITDANGMTNLANIYAVGDCAMVEHFLHQQPIYLPLATVANKMARVVAGHIANSLIETTTNELPNAQYSPLGATMLLFLDYEIAKVGITHQQAVHDKLPYVSVFVSDYDHSNYYKTPEKIYCQLVFDAKTGIIVGGQLCGKQGVSLRIHALSVAIYKQLTVTELSMLDFAYSPPFNKTWDILNIAGSIAQKQLI